jgi:hypothetical protein
MKFAAIAAVSFAAAISAQAMTSCPMTGDPLVKVQYVSFFEGDPAQMVEVAPDDASAGGKLDLTWQFGPRKPEGVTMVCSYSNAEKDQAPLPEGVTVCKLTGEVDAGGAVTGSPTLVCQ